MAENEQNYELFAEAINNIAEKMSAGLLQEYMQLPEELQKSIVLIKAVQLVLANILCQIAITKEELDEIANQQGADIKELIYDCAMTAFAKKFSMSNH